MHQKINLESMKINFKIYKKVLKFCEKFIDALDALFLR